MKKVDYHIHSNLSDGDGTFKQIIDKAKSLNMDSIAITDHFDLYDEKNNVNLITEEDTLNHFEQVKAYAEKVGLRVFCGIETCTDFKGHLRISDKLYNNCDVIITSPHYVEYEYELIPGNYYDKRYWNTYMEKVINMASGEGNILGHPESYFPYKTLLIPDATTFEGRKDIARNIAENFFDMDYIDSLADCLKKSGKAYELHCITKSPRDKVIEKLIEKGVSLSLGSDGHAISAVCDISWGMDIINKFNADNLQYLL